ncbi:hypothetical protein [Poritiphilus flavus]|uniref:Uncharacterized protein n=1 Tax=Poritiphilus flavus TaxID=2697053 RepID=A0A6L9EB51_9FLAO|nr:hypothetical protein [Poritiphilus flavus]NAS11904.1 hypothetical protein [Poritiphilus flavus]
MTKKTGQTRKQFLKRPGAGSLAMAGMPAMLQATDTKNHISLRRKQMLPQEETVFAVEDVMSGYRAAAPALGCNDSYYQDKAIKWDPVNIKLL